MSWRRQIIIGIFFIAVAAGTLMVTTEIAPQNNPQNEKGEVAQEELTLSAKSKEAIVGQHSGIDVTFSSVLQTDGSVLVNVTMADKEFTGFFPKKSKRTITVKSKSGEPAKLEQEDVAVLAILHYSLAEYLNDHILVEHHLERFLVMFLIFYPVDSYFDNRPENVDPC